MSKIYKGCKTFDRKTSNCVTTGTIAGLRPGIGSQGMKDGKNWVSLSPYTRPSTSGGYSRAV